MQKLITNKRAQALIEFVLVLPILIMLLFSIIDFGTILIRKSELENKINEAYEAAKNTIDGSELYENVKKAVNEDGKDYIKAEIILDSESNYMRIRLTSDVKVITPGLNLILGPPHKTSVERVVLYEKQ